MVLQKTIMPWLLLPELVVSGGCASEAVSRAQSGPSDPGVDQPPIVDVATARSDIFQHQLTYTGTTRPLQQISLTSRVEGQLLEVRADVGDAVSQGQVIARLDNDLLLTAVQEAEAELAARQFEVDQAESQLAEARTQVEQAKATLQQAQADAKRLQPLAQDGAISAQDAELAVTNRRTAEQVLLAAEEQVRTRDRAIASAQRRADSQLAIVNQARERLSYARLASPLAGTVLTKVAEPGDVVQPGGSVVEIGDLSEVHVYIDVSDRDRSRIRLSQPVAITLDAFPDQTFTGRITRISPVADAAARLIPVEITMPNPNGLIGSGLIARVAIDTEPRPAIVIPQSALDVTENATATDSNATDAVVFVIRSDDDERPTIEAQPVQLGQRRDESVEVLAGLDAGEAYVVASDRPLTPGQVVQRSLLSEP